MATETKDIKVFMNQVQDSLEQFHKLHMENLKRISELQLEFMNLCTECNKAQLDRLSQAKNSSDILAAESGITTEFSGKFFDNAKRFFDTASQMQDDMMSMFSDNEFMNQLQSLAAPPSGTDSGSQQGQDKAKRKSS